jgi:MerR family mercuric resistance operon transcriptional regulator
MTATSAPLTIGGLAQAAGVNVETIRFYQRKGLLSRPQSRSTGVRRYTPTELGRVKFIKAAQRLGFTLEEVADLLTLEDGSQCKSAREQAERKLSDVRAKLTDLHHIEAVLSELVRRCTESRGKVRCPLIAALQQP